MNRKTDGATRVSGNTDGNTDGATSMSGGLAGISWQALQH